MSKKSLSRGFTIAELIVVIAIFAIITSVALLDQNRLDSGVLITNLGYETALAVREAQVYGVGVRNSGATDEGAFNGQYGTYFDMNSPSQIVLYADKNGNTTYDASLGEAQFLYSFTNQRGNKITALCLNGYSTFTTGSSCTADSPLKILRVVFTRPSLEAKFYTGDGSDGNGQKLYAGPAYIVVNNVDNNDCRVVVVQPTGQISVEKGSEGHHCQ